MIERIVRLIREGADPFSFLVITFTNAAAAEMREKIRKALADERNNPVVAAAYEKAGAMEISTIHSFCQRLIRQEFQSAGVDPFFQICSGAQKKQLFEDAFREACNVLNDQQDGDYLSFIRQYDQKRAKEIVAAVYEFIMSLPDPFGKKKKKTEAVPLTEDPEHPWFRAVREIIREKVQGLRLILRSQADMFDEYEKQEAYRDVWKADYELVEALRMFSEGQPAPGEGIAGAFVKLPALRKLNDREIDWKDRYQRLREQLKTAYQDLYPLVFPDRERMQREFEGMRDSLRGLEKITRRTHLCFEQNKARYCVLDFSDLEHKALDVLRKEDGQAGAGKRYERIFVDECQDISSIQNAIIRALAAEGTSLFMVGDVKQSIYRFRMANPRLFTERLDAPEKEGLACYYLQENFRSRPEILETVNIVFRDVMNRKTAEVDYTPQDELKPGRTDCPGSVPVTVDLISQEEGKSRLETLADYAAEQIGNLKRKKGYDLKDIVILMPEVSTDGPALSDLLNRRGIPVFFDGKGDFFERTEVENFRNLLLLLSDPHQDLALISVLVNPPFCLTEEELSQIRIGGGGENRTFREAFEKAAERGDELGRKCADVRRKTAEWRYLSSRMNLDDFIWYLAEESGIYPAAGASERGRAAQKNLRSLCLQAAGARKRGIICLKDFLALLSDQQASGEMQAASELGTGDNMVRIMTIHKSKGLQFPVVLCLGLDKGLGGRQDASVKLDADLGLCLPYKDADRRLSRKTAADRIFDWKKLHEVRAEKICLLYVAMTRAKEKLILVGTDQDRPLWYVPSGEQRVLAAEDYLDWILPPLRDYEKKSTTCSQAEKPYMIRLCEDNQQETVETSGVIHNLKPWVETLLSVPPVDELWKVDQEETAAADSKTTLVKNSVTSLLQSARNRLFMEDREQTPEEKRTPDYVERAMKRYRAERRPAFAAQEKKAGGAERGTAVHRFLSLVSLEQVREAGGTDPESLDRLRDRMREEQVFSAEEASWIRTEKISRFFDSSVGRRMLASPEIHREWEFNLYLRERNMILQGMIDCAFREGEGWILVDYKTDRIEDEKAFVELYRPQMEWYEVALRTLTGKPVLESWLYSLSEDKAFPVRNQT